MQTNIQWLSIEGGLAYLENHTGVIRWYGVHQLDNYRCHIGTKPLANTKVISTWSGPLNWLQMNVPDHRLDCFSNNLLGPIVYKTYNLRITDPVVRGPPMAGSSGFRWFLCRWLVRINAVTMCHVTKVVCIWAYADVGSDGCGKAERPILGIRYNFRRNDTSHSG